MRKLIALLLSLCLIAGLMPVMAEEAQANDAVTVEDIFQAGLAAYEAEDYAKAAAYYELALNCYRAEADKGEAAADSDAKTLERLQALNRASIANMSIGEGPVYVIGHRSPDSDTICSAIAYARLLTMLGYPAEAATNGPVNHETAFILKAAGVEAPPVLEDAAGKSIFLVDHSEYSPLTQERTFPADGDL